MGGVGGERGGRDEVWFVRFVSLLVAEHDMGGRLNKEG